MDMLADLPPGGPPKDGAESPSISDDEQYQKLDGDLWQQGQGGGQLGVGTRPAGTLVATSEEPEVQQAETDDRKVCRFHRSAQIFLELKIHNKVHHKSRAETHTNALYLACKLQHSLMHDSLLVRLASVCSRTLRQDDDVIKCTSSKSSPQLVKV